jgi:hypothetical protein
MRVVGRTILIVFAIAVVLGAAYQIATHTDVGRRWLETKHRRPAHAVVFPPTGQDPAPQVAILAFKRFKVDTEVAFADVTIANGNPFRVGDITIRCKFQDATGTNLSETSNHLMGDVLPANAQKAYEHMALGFVKKETRNAVCAMAEAKWHW